MSRSNRRRNKSAPVNRHVDGQRNSIGENHVENACIMLNTAAQRECELNLRRFKGNELVPWMFDPDTLRKAAAVKGIVRPANWTQSYEVASKVTTYINFTDLPWVTVEPTQYQTGQFYDADPNHFLFEAAREAQVILAKYARVKHLLRWFNCHATPSAVRHYWPAVMVLCPGSPANTPEAPSRFDTPTRIGAMLPMIRETANTVAAMQLLSGDVKPRGRGDVWLYFREQCDVFYDGDVGAGVEYYFGELTINL